MSLPTPKFETPCTAYVRQSAMRGQVTSVYLVKMTFNSGWIYSVGLSKSMVVNPLNYGERRVFTMANVNAFEESELLTYCEALDYAIDYHRTQLATLQSYKATGCPNEPTSGS